MRSRALTLATTLMLALGSAASPGATAAPICSAESATQMLAIVELDTSESCSSCPPADCWLSTLKGRPGVLALASHVNYWDHLGWSDRFATAEGTRASAPWPVPRASRRSVRRRCA